MTKSAEPHAASIKSDDLLQPREISKESLRHLIALAERGEMRLVDWERFGQPAVDRVVCTVEGPIAMAGSFVDSVFKTSGLRARIRDIFPKGIPRPDVLRFEVEVLPEVRGR